MYTKCRQYITVLSVLSALAVVFLHANGCFWGFSYEPYWLTANVIESVFYFAVPVFFMDSGANLLITISVTILRHFLKNELKNTYTIHLLEYNWACLYAVYRTYFFY